LIPHATPGGISRGGSPGAQPPRPPALSKPAVPSSQVGFEADGRALNRTGEVDTDGKAIVHEPKLPDVPR
jgi:hypothetical protein